MLEQNDEPVANRTQSKKRVQEASKDKIEDYNQILMAEALLAEEDPTTYEETTKSSSSK